MTDTNTTTLTERTINTIQISDCDVSVKEYQGERVITFKDIDTVHKRADGTAKRNFNTHKDRFIEGTDYYSIPYLEFSTKFVPNHNKGGNPNNQVVLLTESGYLMLVKSFTDDLAWEVQRQLVNTYFRVKQVVSDNLILAEKNAQLEVAVKDMQTTLQFAVGLLTAKPVVDMKTVNIWKSKIAKPLIDEISETTNTPPSECYKIVYRTMNDEYGFCESAALNWLATNYDCENNSTINAIAIQPIYQEWFTKSAKKILRLLIGNTENLSIQILPVAEQAIEQLAEVQSGTAIKEFTTKDNTEDIIVELAKLLGDKTENKVPTRRKIYSQITTQRGWKQLMTRYRCQSKKDVVNKVETYKKKFVKVCNDIAKVA